MCAGRGAEGREVSPGSWSNPLRNGWEHSQSLSLEKTSSFHTRKYFSACTASCHFYHVSLSMRRLRVTDMCLFPHRVHAHVLLGKHTSPNGNVWRDEIGNKRKQAFSGFLPVLGWLSCLPLCLGMCAPIWRPLLRKFLISSSLKGSLWVAETRFSPGPIPAPLKVYLGQGPGSCKSLGAALTSLPDHL